MAVVLFDTYGHDKAAPVKRNSKRHIHTPFRRPQPTAYALCSAGTRISHFPTDCKRPVRRMGEGYQKTTVTVPGGGCLFAREPARGVSFPTGDLYLFPRRKRYQKGAGGGPPVPPASPFGRYSILILFALCCSWADSPEGASPSSAAAQRLSTGPNGGEAAGGVPAVLPRSDSEGPPLQALSL